MEDDSAVNDPLIENEQASENTTTNLIILQHVVGHGAANGRPSSFVWGLTFVAGISGLLFGYDTGVISSTLVSIGSDLSHRPLSTLDKSLITSCTSLFALVASPAAGLLADRLGRKRVIVIADVLFAIGALWQAVSSTVWGMIVGRSVVGLAVGAASFVVPLYISELSPAAFRGRLVTLSVLFISGGQMIAYLNGWGLSIQEHGWRWMVGLGAVPAILQFGLMLLLPESPRWLCKSGQTGLARNVLNKVYGQGSHLVVAEVLRAIDLEITEEKRISRHPISVDMTSKYRIRWVQKLQDAWAQLAHVGGNRRALTIACLLQGLQQLCGFNSLMYFSATIFSFVGFDSPILASLSVAVTNCIFTIAALLLIDRIGRRRILLLSIPVMVLGLLLTAVSFRFLPQEAGTTAGVSQQNTQYGVWPVMILLSIIVYVGSYALGLGNVPWQQSELFPLSVRALGSGLATSTNWAANFVVGLTFLPMMNALSPSWTFVTYSVVCLLGCGCIWRIYPETKGLGLEEVSELLRNGWGVRGREKQIVIIQNDG